MVECIFGDQERATLSPKMALTLESRDTGYGLKLSLRNDPMINHLSEHLRRLQSHLPLGYVQSLIKMMLEDEEGVVKAITHLPPEAGTMGGDPASNNYMYVSDNVRFHIECVYQKF